MSPNHPTDRRLAALIDSALAPSEAQAVAEHVAACARCQQRVGQAGPAVPNRPQIRPDIDPIVVIPANGAFESREDPRAGDIWRVAWDGVTELALVRHVDHENALVSVLPVMDAENSDEWSMLTTVVIGDVEMPLAASIALEATLPWCVLDARVGGLDPDAMAVCAAFRAAFRAGGEPPEEATVGEPVLSRLDERAEALDDLAERFHDLANINWVPVPDVVESTASALPQFAELRRAGLPPERALEIQRGDQATAEEALAIQEALGVRVGSELTVVPIDLRRRLDRPRWRPHVRRRAAVNQRSEADERLAVVAEVTQPIAARGTRGQPVDWDFLLERVLRE